MKPTLKLGSTQERQTRQYRRYTARGFKFLFVWSQTGSKWTMPVDTHVENE